MLCFRVESVVVVGFIVVGYCCVCHLLSTDERRVLVFIDLV